MEHAVNNSIIPNSIEVSGMQTEDQVHREGVLFSDPGLLDTRFSGFRLCGNPGLWDKVEFERNVSMRFTMALREDCR
jgi:hypothetical protein